jgi:plasmid stabilization system protein ParE
MAENILPVIYTNRSISDSIAIKNFILVKFTDREVNNFYKMLETFERVVSAFPDLYPQSITNQYVRRAVLSKQLSVFYKVKKNEISVIAMIDNRIKKCTCLSEHSEESCKRDKILRYAQNDRREKNKRRTIWFAFLFIDSLRFDNFLKVVKSIFTPLTSYT